MLKDRIFATLKFFDLQDWPLTLLELHQYLLAEPQQLKGGLDENWQLREDYQPPPATKVAAGELLTCLERDCGKVVENHQGFYCLAGRQKIAEARLGNYLFGIKREKLLRRFALGLKRVPFVRGVGLAGSQALGQQREGSDIDLLILTHPEFLWLTRTLVTAYFQLLGKRRHGKKVANRFCLNHYIAGTKRLRDLHNLYTAMEYIKLRPLVCHQNIAAFQQQNAPWIMAFFPNWEPLELSAEPVSGLQSILEKALANRFGRALERWLKSWQLLRIKKEEFILIRDDELSFHPGSRQKFLLTEFFARAKID